MRHKKKQNNKKSLKFKCKVDNTGSQYQIVRGCCSESNSQWLVQHFGKSCPKTHLRNLDIGSTHVLCTRVDFPSL